MSEESSRKPKLSPYIGLAMGVLTASTSAVFIRYCHAPAFIIGFYRLFLGGLFMLGLAFYKNQSFRLNIQRKDIFWGLLGGLFLALHFATWIKCLSYTRIASAAILSGTQPLFVSFFGWLLLKEKLKSMDTLGLIIAFTGGIVISGGDWQLGGKELIGDIMAISSGMFAAGYFLVGRKIRKNIEITNYLGLLYTSAAFWLALLSLSVHNSFYPYPKDVFFWIFMLAIFPTLMGHSLYNWSLKYLSAHRVGMATFIEPLLTSFQAFIFFSEIPGIGTFVGGTMVFTGLIISWNWGKQDKEPSLETEE